MHALTREKHVDDDGEQWKNLKPKKASNVNRPIVGTGDWKVTTIEKPEKQARHEGKTSNAKLNREF